MSGPDLDPRRPDLAKTTLYLPRALRTAVKRAALDGGMSLNGYVVAALERAVAQRSPSDASMPSNPGLSPDRRVEPELAALHLTVQALASRLAAVEQTLGTPRAGAAARAPHPLSVREVRAVVREILVDRKAPIPHRTLLDHLQQERQLVLPGRDPSENLRTILVHPKSVGFIFLRKRGYWVDDLPVPPQNAT